MKKDRLIILISILILNIIITTIIKPITVYGHNNLSLKLKILGKDKASCPDFCEGNVILTYKSEMPVRIVGARFKHENFKNLHIYKKNNNDVFFLVYPIPEGYDCIEYKIVVDGLWMKDPFNKGKGGDDRPDADFSVIKLEKKYEKSISNPSWEGKYIANFIFKGKEGLDIYIIGDFNNWTPYAHRLKEMTDKPGYYTLSLRVGSGRHHYNFIVNGLKISDPFNKRKVYDKGGNYISYFDVIL